MIDNIYAVLESETRLAVAALGLDPGLGFWHVDTPARDSLACDLMEPVRPQVDSFLLDWITREPLKRAWFFEQRDGDCRLMGPFAVQLSETAATWGRAVAPIAEWVAQTLWTGARTSVRSDLKLPSRLTQRRRSEGRGKDFVLNIKPAPYPTKLCPGCGAKTRLGRHCSKCAREVSRDKLIELAKVGRIAAQSPEARKKHSATQRRHEAAKRAWRSSPNPARLDEAVYSQEIHPRLMSVTISAISSALGISESYAADIRAGRHRPHPRHWQALAELVGAAPSEYTAQYYAKINSDNLVRTTSPRALPPSPFGQSLE
jgi:CRISPR associated protein Cas1